MSVVTEFTPAAPAEAAAWFGKSWVLKQIVLTSTGR